MGGRCRSSTPRRTGSGSTSGRRISVGRLSARPAGLGRAGQGGNPMTADAAETAAAARTSIRYEEPAPAVARIVLAREDTRNAQDKAMLYELNAAFDRAAQDDEIRVIILAADGP